ncbi:hypothetical protein NDU88_003628 [Pleurodeles waltl]|uniref:Uncharacterized protein n=1 Tax=Pleurodeles waltl TaxID=8319 RepID=A0AAV7WPL0_PLEWA|nr:hypothetical protein NDU88_003628 [Pleurodeles waltl]
MRLVASERKGESRTLWVLPERKEESFVLDTGFDGVVFEVVGELCVDDLLDDFRWEREEGDRTEVFEIVDVSLRFLEEGLDFSCFQLSGKLAVLKERLMILRSLGAMVTSALLKT